MRPSLLAASLALGAASLSAVPVAHAAWDEWVDQRREAWTVPAPGGDWLGRTSGRLTLGLRYADRPLADLAYHADGRKWLAAPVAQYFGDVARGPLYVFGQLRLDRGFDARETGLQGRLQEFAMRWTPGGNGPFALQAGQFATVFGSYARRQHAWDYPFATAPLAQEALVGLWDTKGLPALGKIEEWPHVTPLGSPRAVAADELNRIPLMWGAVYALGASARWTGAHWDAAFEAKNAGLSSRPTHWADDPRAAWREPALAGRVGWRPSATWSFGASWARGIYLRPEPETVFPGARRRDYVQTTWGLDAAFAWREWQVWAEGLAARFTVPGFGTARATSFSLETKRRFTPGLALAGRIGWQDYANYQPPAGPPRRWGRDTWRIEAGPVVRLAAHAQWKLQLAWTRERPSPLDHQWGAATELALRF